MVPEPAAELTARSPLLRAIVEDVCDGDEAGEPCETREYDIESDVANSLAAPRRRKRSEVIDFIERIDQSAVEGLEQIAESDLFAIYAMGRQTYLLVQRHKGTPWMALRLSGDGLFRISALLGDATRHLYREMASHLSPNYLAEIPQGSRRTEGSDDAPRG